MDIISEDAFNYMINTFLTKGERTLLKLVNGKYNKCSQSKINIKSLVINNNLETLKLLNIKMSAIVISNIAKTAAEYGHLQILQWLQNDCPNGIGVFNKAVSTGQLHIMEWLLSHNPKLGKGCLRTAIKHKQYKCIEWLFSKVEQNNDIWFDIYDDDAYKEAAKLDNLHLMKRLHKENVLRDIDVDCCIFEVSAQYGSLETIKWLLNPNGIDGQNIYSYDQETISKLIERKDLQLIKFMYDINPDAYSYNEMLNDGISTGNLDIVKFLYEIGGHFSEESFNKAALTGNLELMKWLLVRNDFSNNTFHYAAINGNMEVMKWLRNKGCIWNEFTFQGAVDNGNKDNIKWLIENGCPWDAKSLFRSCSAFKNVPNKKERDSKLLEYVKWLYGYLSSKNGEDRKFGWDADMFAGYVFIDCIPVLQFLLNPKGKKECHLTNGRDEEHACPWSTNTYNYAIRNNKLDVFKWLYQRGCPYDMKTINYIIHMTRYDFLEWILSNKLYDGNLKDYLVGCLDRGSLKCTLVMKDHMKLIDDKTYYYIKEWISNVKDNVIIKLDVLHYSINRLGWHLDYNKSGNIIDELMVVADWIIHH